MSHEHDLHDPEEPSNIEGVDAEEEETRDSRVRTVGIGLTAGIAVALAGMTIIGSVSNEGVIPGAVAHASERTEKSFELPLPPAILASVRVLDTLYTTDSVYLEVNLARQDVTVHFRNGTSRHFLVSSGNPYIREGMSTPHGLFTVQNMTPMALSRQFNNARLHHWVGVQGGIGFHGLDGSGYYGYLGVRPSSHGCLRMSREQIAEMYKLVHPGAPIMVHSGNPARVVAFCDPEDTAGARVIDSAAVYDRALGKDRMESLMAGRYWIDHSPRLVHLAGQRLRWGLQIGDARKVPKQELPKVHFAEEFSRHLPTSQRDRLERGATRDLAVLAESLDSLRRVELAQDSADQAVAIRP